MIGRAASLSTMPFVSSRLLVSFERPEMIMSMWMMGIKVCERQREGYSEVDDTYRERERERRVKRETEI